MPSCSAPCSRPSPAHAATSSDAIATSISPVGSIDNPTPINFAAYIIAQLPPPKKAAVGTLAAATAASPG
eukprot:1236203-Prymnesium_polylepis.2